MAGFEYIYFSDRHRHYIKKLIDYIENDYYIKIEGQRKPAKIVGSMFNIKAQKNVYGNRKGTVGALENLLTYCENNELDGHTDRISFDVSYDNGRKDTVAYGSISKDPFKKNALNGKSKDLDIITSAVINAYLTQSNWVKRDQLIDAVYTKYQMDQKQWIKSNTAIAEKIVNLVNNYNGCRCDCLYDFSKNLAAVFGFNDFRMFSTIDCWVYNRQGFDMINQLVKKYTDGKIDRNDLMNGFNTLALKDNKKLFVGVSLKQTKNCHIELLYGSPTILINEDQKLVAPKYNQKTYSFDIPCKFNNKDAFLSFECRKYNENSKCSTSIDIELKLKNTPAKLGKVRRDIIRKVFNLPLDTSTKNLVSLLRKDIKTLISLSSSKNKNIEDVLEWESKLSFSNRSMFNSKLQRYLVYKALAKSDNLKKLYTDLVMSSLKLEDSCPFIKVS